MLKTLARLIAIGAIATPLAANAVVYQFNAFLSGASEVPNPALTTANGVSTLFYNDFGTVATGDDKYDFSMSVFGLSGGTVAGTAASGFHIHGAATVAQNAGVRVFLDSAPFVNLNIGSTLLVGGSDVSPVADFATPANGFALMSFLDVLKGQLAYVNVHTLANPGGAVRGQLIQVAVVPEPETYAMLLAGLGLIGWIGARRRHTRS